MKTALIVVLVILCCGAQATTQRCRSYIPVSTPSDDFIPNAEGTVIHTVTGLMWMRCSIGQQWDGNSCSGRAQSLTWYTAEKEAKNSHYADFRDWRLPTREELEGILERSCETPAINTEIFPATPSNWYWSASIPGRGDSADHLAWYVSFGLGRVHNQQKTLFGRVRLVRPGGE